MGASVAMTLRRRAAARGPAARQLEAVSALRAQDPHRRGQRRRKRYAQWLDELKRRPETRDADYDDVWPSGRPHAQDEPLMPADKAAWLAPPLVAPRRRQARSCLANRRKECQPIWRARRKMLGMMGIAIAAAAAGGEGAAATTAPEKGGNGA